MKAQAMNQCLTAIFKRRNDLVMTPIDRTMHMPVFISSSIEGQVNVYPCKDKLFNATTSKVTHEQ
jgi:hypothetical protein